MTRSTRARRFARLTAALVGLAALTLPLPAGAAVPTTAAAVPATVINGDEANIDYVEPHEDGVEILYSVPGQGGGAEIDLSSVQVTVDGEPVEAAATTASEAEEQIRRTSILAIDTSRSMRGQRFVEAKRAASVYLETAPDDVYVGIVGFAGTVEVIAEPTRDRAALRDALDELTLSFGTLVYDGVLEAVRLSGGAGLRSILVLSDGRDTSATELDEVTALVSTSGVKLNVVSLDRSSGAARRAFEAMVVSGEGAVLEATDPAALSRAFSDEADALARQIQVTAQVPADRTSREAQLEVTVDAGGQSFTDAAFVTVGAPPQDTPPTAAGPLPLPKGGFVVTSDVMLGGILATGLGVLLVLLAAFGVFSKSKRKLTVEDRVGAFSRSAPGPSGGPGQPVAQPPQSLSGQAVGVAQKALSGNRGLEVNLGKRLDGAGISLKPAEWLLTHAGIAFGSGLVGLLLSSGGLLVTVGFLLLGAVLPWVYLGVKRSKRMKKFNSQLADTLQLMAGSLSAGLSLAQSLDTVEREGNEPIAGEFRRALVETRLGVSIEEALESVGERMESKDFDWVVMAIRIQREVGGNLAELLLTVAATLRDREYLRRHVSALSAEGRLSCWILGGLPPVFMLYLTLTKPSYLAPLFSTPIGLVMCVAMALLLASGIFWMSRLVKVDI